jgi:riboflavin synthase
MFTGLVAATGILVSREARGPGARLSVRAAFSREPAESPGPAPGEQPLELGESIAIDGACLSVATILPDGFEVDATAETLARTTLGQLGLGAAVNLERAVRAGDRLGGHLVTGHVDGVGALEARRPVGEAVHMSFGLPAELAPLVAEKGSIAINGVSMTVNRVSAGVRGPSFDVTVIPLTQQATNLGALAVGDRVNLEADLIARYVARIVTGAGGSG